jgi:large subunit GTPase 1
MPKPKKQQSSLGKSLINKKKRAEHSKQHVSDIYEVESNKLKSVIDQNTLQDFLQEVELSSRNFEATKEFKVRTEHHVIDLNSINNLKPKVQVDTKNLILRVPRRPKWDSNTTAEQLNQMENDNFLTWRRDLAKLEEELLIDRTFTPFEKNLEVWKQLWRVVEKADIVVQIVDGRNPLFYRCPDLEKYVKEMDTKKENILLINKSDLLSDPVRKAWNKYLNDHGINHIFFSAKSEQEKIDTDRIEAEEALEQIEEIVENTERIFTRKNLMQALKHIVLKVKKQKLESQEPSEAHHDDKSSLKTNFNPNLVTIGMVGYPNVGKSSVINVLCKKKLVGVAAQPGKTKHFQTLLLEKDLMICDCPGLVFPNFTSNRAEMVCNGVLPIDKLRDYLNPIQYLCQRLPKKVFEVLYKVKIEIPNPTGSQILQAYSKQRGHLTGSALPDETRAARVFLKDLVAGKLLYCALPPDYDKERDGDIIQYDESLFEKEEEPKNKEIEEEKVIELDKNGELVDQKKRPVNDDEFFDELPPEDEDDPYEGLDNEDLLMILLEGKPVRGLKLTKNQRRDIKFALKRGEKINVADFFKVKKSGTGVKSLGVHGSENFSRAPVPQSIAVTKPE